MRAWLRSRDRRWVSISAVGAGFVIAATGCVGLPDGGPVQEGLERAPEPEGIVFLAPDPRPGGTAEEIVEGFLDAATAGVADRFETAQKYLTDDARRAWKPSAGLTVYAGNTPPDVKEYRSGRVNVSMPVSGYVDARGVYTEESPDTTKMFEFTLTEVAGQWRISDLDDGVYMSAVNFGTQYREVSLSYFSTDGQFIIPDPRWFPEQNSASFATNALLEGPSQWLLPGVVTAIPGGTLAEPVTVTDGTAEVILSQTALAASPSDRRIIAAQVEHTLTQLPRVRRVEMFVNDVPFADEPHEITPTLEPAVGQSPVVIHDGMVAAVVGDDIEPLPGSVEFDAKNINAFAVPYGDLNEDALPIVARVGKDTIATVPWEGLLEPTVFIADSGGVVAPSYDRYGWVWTGSVSNTGTLMTIEPGTDVVTMVAAPAFTEHKVRAIRVSRDGARIASLVEQDGRVMIHVSMVIRDEEGVPVEVTEPVSVGQSVSQSTDLGWIDAQTLSVLGVSDDGAPTVHVVPIAGPSVALLSVPGADSVAGGRGERDLWVGTSDGQLYSRAGNGWRRLADELTVTAFTFPG